MNMVKTNLILLIVLSVMSVIIIIGYRNRQTIFRYDRPIITSSIYCDNSSSPSQNLHPDEGVVWDCISRYIIRNRTKIRTRNFNITISTSKFKQTETQIERQESFQTIYSNRAWGGPSSNVDERVSNVIGSGPGSDLLFAQEAMGVLHTIINEIKVKNGKNTVSILDIPCGDFQWMSRFLQERTDVIYTGMDIVPHLIKNHQEAFKYDPNLQFIHQDIVTTPLTEGYDIILCRMMLQHLTNDDLMKVLHHFDISGSSFLLATTHPGASETSDVNIHQAHRFRYLNLEVPPVQLESPLCMTRDGPRDNGAGDHYLALWSFPLKQLEVCSVKNINKPPHSKVDFYICG